MLWSKTVTFISYIIQIIACEKENEKWERNDAEMKRETVEKALIEMGMPVKLKGFQYIVDAVMLLDTPEWKNPKWTALYYKIGMMHQDTESRVERAIRNAFTTTRNRIGNYEAIEHYIGFTNCENSNSIVFLYKNIKQEAALEIIPEEADMQSFNDVTAAMIRDIVRQTLKEMLFETV